MRVKVLYSPLLLVILALLWVGGSEGDLVLPNNQFATQHATAGPLDGESEDNSEVGYEIIFNHRAQVCITMMKHALCL